MSEVYPEAQPVAPVQPRINLDLDSLERDPVKAKREPFRFVAGGRAIVLIDPEELDWEVVAYAQSDPPAILRAAMTVEDRKFISGLKIPVWKIAELADNYLAYYDLGDIAGNVG